MRIFRTLHAALWRTQTIEKIDVDQLRRERIKMEQTETRVTAEIEQLEQQKEAFFRKGVQCGSERQKLQIARKIKELDARVRIKDKQLSMISKDLRLLSGVAQVKENEKMLRELGVGGLLSKMDLDELQAYVERAMVEGQFQMERFTGLLETLEKDDMLGSAADEDSETRAILAAMDAVAGSEGEQAVSEGMRRVDAALRTGRQQEADEHA